MKNSLSTILLLGGKGTRLRSVINDRPKVMAPINGKPFLEILLDELIKFNIENIVLSTGYKSKYIEENMGDKYRNLNLMYSTEETPRGTAGGALLAIKKYEAENYLIMNGDNFIEFDLPSFYEFHNNNSNNITMLVKEVDDLARFGSVTFDSSMKVQEFKEKDPFVNSGFINCGVYLLNSCIIDLIPTKVPSSLETDFFPNMLDKSFFAVETKGRHLDIGTPESYESAQHFFN
jgi:NDP-sugar pyrophosphorylase family protein